VAAIPVLVVAAEAEVPLLPRELLPERAPEGAEEATLPPASVAAHTAGAPTRSPGRIHDGTNHGLRVDFAAGPIRGVAVGVVAVGLLLLLVVVVVVVLGEGTEFADLEGRMVRAGLEGKTRGVVAAAPIPGAAAVVRPMLLPMLAMRWCSIRALLFAADTTRAPCPIVRAPAPSFPAPPRLVLGSGCATPLGRCSARLWRRRRRGREWTWCCCVRGGP
jgi:hypothetical protein